MSGGIEALPVRDRRIDGAGEIRPGDVRLVNGVAGLVVREWIEGDSFIVCPVKPITDDEGLSGRFVLVEMDRAEMGLSLYDAIFTDPDPDDPTGLHGAALPRLGGTVLREFVGRLLYRVRPHDLHRCAVIFGNEFTDTGEKDDPDSDLPNSDSDLELSRRIQEESLRRELDSSPAYVFEDDGSVRLETDAEWRARVRRRRKAEKRARKA